MSIRPLRTAWGHRRCRQQLRSYIGIREKYASRASELGLAYDLGASTELVRSRMRARGYSPIRRDLGDVHTFLWLPEKSWHSSLLPALMGLGEVSRFDYESCIRVERSCGGGWRPEWRQAVARHAYDSFVTAHRRRPVDWVFTYANGLEMDARWPTRIAQEFGVPVVNMCLDDKHSWSLGQAGRQDGGQIDIAAAFDLTWTSSRVAAEWYLVEGGVPIYMPEGFEPSYFGPREVGKDKDVVFVGGDYGFRRDLVEEARRAGIGVETFGEGWGSPRVTREEMVGLFNRAWVVLGMGGIGYDRDFTTLKGRDFEAPGSGGGLYLTSYNPEFAENFRVTEEVACYSTPAEMVELLRYYLQRKDLIRSMSEKARDHAMEEHTWRHRYLLILESLGICGPGVSA